MFEFGWLFGWFDLGREVNWRNPKINESFANKLFLKLPLIESKVEEKLIRKVGSLTKWRANKRSEWKYQFPFNYTFLIETVKKSQFIKINWEKKEKKFSLDFFLPAISFKTQTIKTRISFSISFLRFFSGLQFLPCHSSYLDWQKLSSFTIWQWTVNCLEQSWSKFPRNLGEKSWPSLTIWLLATSTQFPAISNFKWWK